MCQIKDYLNEFCSQPRISFRPIFKTMNQPSFTDPDQSNEAEEIAEEDRPGNGLPAMSGGVQAPRVEPDDEGSLAEEEVEEGIAEADLDTRARSRH
jgi:hypothetical protein